MAIVDDEADAGMYSVKATTTNGVSATVTITVSDVAISIMVSCDPEMIDPRVRSDRLHHHGDRLRW